MGRLLVFLGLGIAALGLLVMPACLSAGCPATSWSGADNFSFYFPAGDVDRPEHPPDADPVVVPPLGLAIRRVYILVTSISSAYNFKKRIDLTVIQPARL